MKRVSAGDIVLIPVSVGGYGVSKVLFVSKRSKNVILLGIYKLHVMEATMPQCLPDHFEKLIYTGSQGIGEGKVWPRVGNAPVSEREEAMSCRIVADHVYLGDECVRPATSVDRKTIPTMGVAGAGWVEEDVMEVIGSARIPD